MTTEKTSPGKMPVPLLATRFYFPQLPAAWIARPRLMGLLENGLHLPLILVSAPPGFGKSSLVTGWIHQHPGMKSGWLSLEKSDRDWGDFFRYLVAAWQRVFPQAGFEALAELNESSSRNHEVLVTLLLNDLLACQDAAGAGHALLVLDDYHHIESAAIHETMTYLVEHLPARCHMALLTRSDPPLPLARWRSRGQMLEIRADHLRFSTAEASDYLNQSMHLTLADEQIEVLQERTEGWIAGLQMAALAMQGLALDGFKDTRTFVREFGGSNRYVIDYLVEEVVRQQPEEIQQFLLATAFLDRFCGPLCDAVSGAASPFSQRILERLEKANLFLIALDDRRYWFRYHHLFAELINIRLQQTDPERIPVFHRRAAEWFAQNGLPREAVHHAARYSALTGDYDYSAGMYEQAIVAGGRDFLYSGMQGLIDHFPQPLIETRPLLSLAKTIEMYERSRLEGIEPLAHFAARGIQAMPPFENQAEILGWAYVIQSCIAVLAGNSAWALEASSQVARWIPQNAAANIDSLLQAGVVYYYEGSLNEIDSCWQRALDLSMAYHHMYYMTCSLDSLGRLCAHKGELNRAEGLYQRSLTMLAGERGPLLRWLGAAQRDYADLLRERNQLQEARQMAEAGLPLCETWDRKSGYGLACLHMGRILLALGDLAGANAMLERIDELRLTRTIYPDLETLSQIFRAQLLMAAGGVEQARQVLEACLDAPCCKHAFHREWVQIAQARLYLHTGCAAEALALLDGRRESAQSSGRGRNWLEMSLVMALAMHAGGDMRGALQMLGEALVFSQEQGFRRMLLDEGEPMRALLEAYRAQSPDPKIAAYAGEMIAFFPAQVDDARASPYQLAGMYEAFTPREYEILLLVCQGLSNMEIANRLVLSVGTVKFHMHNILGKLGVRDRPQAIAKAAQLGLK